MACNTAGNRQRGAEVGLEVGLASHKGSTVVAAEAATVAAAEAAVEITVAAERRRRRVVVDNAGTTV